ncbi:MULTISPECIES: hypothetical protein [unclassified Streptomyces]|uniref:hypothetical protein n=1 Tax=unclassified Streptomyces TaxID=2593676 RepID=UPI00093AA39E|nr:hypothetical protein [Streptomyces sp. TSRI0281]OKI45270.1 hypothetical protein A6A29_32030 [Streptomyces sp. TSRI0281]
MSTMRRDISLLRCRYTGESLQQARRAIDLLEPEVPPIPAAASGDQQYLEARVLVSLLESRNCYTRYPLGIAAVYPEPEGIALRVESEELASEILFNLLPTYVSDHEVHGVPGLRITQRDRTAVELRVLGTPTRLRLTGLPATLWRNAVAGMLDKWIDPNPTLLCWQSSPRVWTDAERAHHASWEDVNDDFTQVQRRGGWLGSGLLRRAGLLHMVSNTFFVDGYHGGGDTARLVLRSSHVRGQWPGPHNIVAALAHPAFGLPLYLKRFRSDTDECCGRDQQFVLGDHGKTAILDLRTSSEQPGSRLKPELWQAILRRLPGSGFTASLSPSVLAGLCDPNAA